MKISNSGILFVKKEEGEELEGYVDTRGIPTVGVGHTGFVDGKPVTPGMIINQSQSTQLLRSDLTWVENTIRSIIKSPLTQNQYDALCSFVFNIGAAAFSRSTVAKLINAEDYKGGADAMLLWKRAGNNPDILLKRRQRERGLFLT